MIDRIPATDKAGRMLVAPEDGTPAFYAKITMADEPIKEGTPLNKNTLLSGDTERKFGFAETTTVSQALADLLNCSVRDLRTFCVHFSGNKTHESYPFEDLTEYFWTVPSGILGNKVIALVLGGGGGGGLSKTDSQGRYNGGGGGGGGGMHLEVLPVTPGERLDCKVGRGGRGATSNRAAENGSYSAIAGKSGFYGPGGSKGANATTTKGGAGGDGGSGGGGGYCWSNPNANSGVGGNASYGGGGGSKKIGGSGGTYGGAGAKEPVSPVNGAFANTPLENFPTYLFGALTADCQAHKQYADAGYGGSAGYGDVAGGGGFGADGGTDTGAGGGGGGGFFGRGHDGVSTSGGGGGGFLDKYAYGGDGSGKTQTGQDGGDGLIMFIYAMSRETPTEPPLL